MSEATKTPQSSVPVFDESHLKVSSEKEIEYLLKARYPLIYVVSPEEERVGRIMIRLANARKKKIVFWSSTQGFDEQGGADVRDPLAALNYIFDAKDDGVYVLRDFHEYMRVPDIKRRLRDLSREFRSSLKACILLSPVQNIPPEVEKEFAVVDFDMPGLEEIKVAMRGVLSGLPPTSRPHIWVQEWQHDAILMRKVAEAALGLTQIEIENALAKSLVVMGQRPEYDLDTLIELIHAEKEQIIRKSGTLEFLTPDANFHGVGGLGPMKDWLRKRSKAFTPEARAFGLPEPKGILMLGIPGCGKSLMAKAVSSLWKLPLIRLDVGKVFGSLVGQSEEGMRRAVKTAESVAPCILWLDELEKGLAGTQSSGQSDGGTTARVFGTFITWLQEKSSAVFVIGTANNIKMLPPELMRKGRFDEIFFVDLPNKDERREIVSIHITRRGRDAEKFDIEAIVEATEGFSGSEIEQVVISALYDAFDKDDELNDEYLLQSTEETVPLSRTMMEDIASMRDWAKSRARLASQTTELEENEPVRKIEI
jgi:SpoVK/Ycf46/Vps4 family AAA+-type ATPase